MRDCLLSLGLIGTFAWLGAGCAAERHGPGGTGGTGGYGGSTAGSAGMAGSAGSAGLGGTAGMAGSAGTGEVLSVTGTILDTYLTDTGEVADVPRSSATVSALVLNDGGGMDFLKGTYDAAAGSFVIPGVPLGRYDLRASGVRYVVTDERVLDLGVVNGGRPDAKKITTAGTSLIVNATGLTAWQPADSIELFSLGSTTWDALEGLATGKPKAGDTTLANFTVDMSKLAFPGLIDGGKGDVAVLTHLTARSASGIGYTSLAQALTLPSFTVTEGMATTTGGELTDVPQHTVTVDWKRSAFESARADSVPGSVASNHSLLGYVEPGGKDRFSTAAPVSLFSLVDGASTDISLDLVYGNPFPVGWAGVATVAISYGLVENIAGNLPASAKTLRGAITISAAVEDLFNGPITPLVTPPLDVTIEGKATTADLTGVGTAPLISWTAPKVGTPTVYLVKIHPVDAKGISSFVTTLTTTDTSVALPSGVLQPGLTYVAVIEADITTYDPKAPFRGPSGVARASALTHLFTP